MPQPEYVICCGLSFLSPDGEKILRERLGVYHDIVSRIANDPELTPEQIKQLAKQALGQQAS
jgi:hypothetical protein